VTVCTQPTTVPITADQPGRRKPSARKGLPLTAVPGPPGTAAARTVIRVDIGRAGWALAVPPAGLQAPPGRAWRRVSSLPCRLTLARVPGPADPRLGLAVLLHRRRETVICCPEDHITRRAAEVLPALAGQAFQDILGAGGPVESLTGGTGPSVTVTRVHHCLRPADDRHVASLLACGRDVTIEVCHRLISAELADVLGLLCTAYASALLTAGRPSAEIPAASDR
jgi:hypothetical protein